MDEKQGHKQRQNGFTFRKALIVIAGVFIVLAIGTMIIHRNVKSTVDKSIAVNEYYKEGYSTGQKDATQEFISLL